MPLHDVYEQEKTIWVWWPKGNDNNKDKDTIGKWDTVAQSENPDRDEQSYKLV